jgi:hypothetical protein
LSWSIVARASAPRRPHSVARDDELLREPPLPSADLTVCVLAAPKAAVVAGVRSGFFRAGSAGAARETGQAFERAIAERLRSGELSLPEAE